MGLEVTPETLKKLGDALHRMVSDETADRVVWDFLRKYMYNRSQAGSLASEFFKRADRAHWYSLNPNPSMRKALKSRSTRADLTPKEFSKLTKKDLYNRMAIGSTSAAGSKARHTSAFKAAMPSLWKAMSSTQALGSGGFGLVPYDKVMDLRLKDSMPNKSKKSPSRMNSLFLAVEYGTGMFASGAMKGVNASSKYKVGKKGIWAYDASTKEETSPLFLGQRPFNLFYNRSGGARAIYEKFIRRNLPKVMKVVLKEVIKG